MNSGHFDYLRSTISIHWRRIICSLSCARVNGKEVGEGVASQSAPLCCQALGAF